MKVIELVQHIKCDRSHLCLRQFSASVCQPVKIKASVLEYVVTDNVDFTFGEKGLLDSFDLP